MEISEVQIIPIKAKDGLIAFASLVVNQSIYLSSIGIHVKADGSGYRITYPTKQIGIRQINLFHPINKETSKSIEEAIINKAKEVIEKSNDRYNSHNFEAE
ncbi:MAG: septation protein SpoVG family protein [Patescibacteria group bacterium]